MKTRLAFYSPKQDFTLEFVDVNEVPTSKAPACRGSKLQIIDFGVLLWS